MALADESMKGVKTNAQHMVAVGLTISDALTRFGIATLMRVEADRAAKAEADRACRRGRWSS